MTTITIILMLTALAAIVIITTDKLRQEQRRRDREIVLRVIRYLEHNQGAQGGVTGPNPIDTIREALEWAKLVASVEGVDSEGEVAAALAALTEVEHQLADLADALRRAKMRTIDAHDECGIEAPQDFFLKDIADIARAALARQEQR